MNIRVPKYYKNFKCIADRCEDTCCAGWEIVIDDETYQCYEGVKGEFGERLRNEIIVDGEEKIFVLKDDRCPFLNENKKCDIYGELGEEYLCYTCQQYPRYTEEFGSLREEGISLSCPEAARIILGDSTRVEFEVSETEGEASYNDIDAMLYMELMQCRQIIFNILQDREIDINSRAALVLSFTEEIQEEIDKGSFLDLKSIKGKYRNKETIDKLVSSYSKYNNEFIKLNHIERYFQVLKNLQHINEDDPLNIENAFKYFRSIKDYPMDYLEKHNEFNVYYEDKIYKFENILVYFVFRYFMKAVFDENPLDKIKLALFSYIIIKELCIMRWIENGELTEEDIVEISHIYSKDVEHLLENIDALEESFNREPMFSVDEIITVLVN